MAVLRRKGPSRIFRFPVTNDPCLRPELSLSWAIGGLGFLGPGSLVEFFLLISCGSRHNFECELSCGLLLVRRVHLCCLRICTARLFGSVRNDLGTKIELSWVPRRFRVSSLGRKKWSDGIDSYTWSLFLR